MAPDIQGGRPAPPAGHGFAQLLVAVDAAACSVAAAVDLGARVIVPPQEPPVGEAMAVLLDPKRMPSGPCEPRRRARRPA
jgi:hypothetical protein